jgi:hypothetical protein
LRYRGGSNRRWRIGITAHRYILAAGRSLGRCVVSLGNGCGHLKRERRSYVFGVADCRGGNGGAGELAGELEGGDEEVVV